MNNKDKMDKMDKMIIIKDLIQTALETLIVAINKPELPVLFEDTCEKCERKVMHRSWVQKPMFHAGTAFVMAASSQSYFPYQGNAIKTCLSCGHQTAKKEETK